MEKTNVYFPSHFTASSCSLDPLPTKLVKEFSHSLVPHVTHVVNLSLSSGVFPQILKHALVKPLLKKSNLDSEIMKNYRPVSNIAFIGKVIEKVVAERLIRHMNQNNLNEQMQSAYRAFHSTETALTRIHNDILLELDKKKSVLLCLLDLSSAFDTIDHQTLYNILSERLGIKGTALQWFRSYLSQRTQSVTISGDSSASKTLRFGVPQGSVLGPLLYTIYTLTIGDILRHHDIPYHL